jgi:hypothetical protein
MFFLKAALCIAGRHLRNSKGALATRRQSDHILPMQVKGGRFTDGA